MIWSFLYFFSQLFCWNFFFLLLGRYNLLIYSSNVVRLDCWLGDFEGNRIDWNEKTAWVQESKRMSAFFHRPAAERTPSASHFYNATVKNRQKDIRSIGADRLAGFLDENFIIDVVKYRYIDTFISCRFSLNRTRTKQKEQNNTCIWKKQTTPLSLLWSLIVWMLNLIGFAFEICYLQLLRWWRADYRLLFSAGGQWNALRHPIDMRRMARFIRLGYEPFVFGLSRSRSAG